MLTYQISASLGSLEVVPIYLPGWVGWCHTGMKTNLSSQLDWHWTCQLELSLAKVSTDGITTGNNKSLVHIINTTPTTDDMVKIYNIWTAPTVEDNYNTSTDRECQDVTNGEVKNRKVSPHPPSPAMRIVKLWPPTTNGMPSCTFSPWNAVVTIKKNRMITLQKNYARG